MKKIDQDFYDRRMILYIHILFFSKLFSRFEKFYRGSRKNKNNVRLKDKFRNDRSHDLINGTKKLKSLCDFNWQCHIFVPLSRSIVFCGQIQCISSTL